MSYLNPLRLHFAGKFQASVSTVNNDPIHYDNAQFKPEYQEIWTQTAANGWWNPRGDANWRLIGCQVTAAYLSDGKAVHNDPILDYLVADSDHQVAAKIADLDTQQQLVSMIWGLEVRITTPAGDTLLRGQFVPAAFMDLWDRSPSGGGDIGAGSMFQSVLTDLEWGNISASPFLQELQASATDGLLSIRFNVDAYDMALGSPDFTRGRITGTIGPASVAEPRHFVPGRQLMTTDIGGAWFFTPANQLNFCVATVNEQVGKIYLDLGNSLPAPEPGGAPPKLGPLELVCEVQPAPDSGGAVQRLSLGSIPQGMYQKSTWYAETAGVVELPTGRRLTSTELATIANNPLMITFTDDTGQSKVAVAEPPQGLYVRADQFVFRLDPGDQAQMEVYATRFGQPYPQATVMVSLDPSHLQQATGSAVGTPAEALSFAPQLTTDVNGKATLSIGVGDPGNPRGYIDGQVYGVRLALQETTAPGTSYPVNPWNFISLLVWDAFQADNPPSWHGSLEPIFTQYANLYPVMDRFLNLADYESVCEHRRLLLLAFGLDANNPNTMPVTRDLSSSKRNAILQWLSTLGPDGKPLKGTPPPQALQAPAPSAQTASAQAAQEESPEQAIKGGKAAASKRRLIHLQK